jgi:hypothetical protein
MCARIVLERAEMNIEDSLKTREQKFKDKKWNKMFVSRKVITSKAYLSLRTPAACQVYLAFLSKCRVEKVQTRPGRRDKEWQITNNGEIQFTYDEAEERWGISEGRFLRAIDQLVEVGLIDITKSGFGLHKDVSLYAISDRWEKYGTAEFVRKERRKRTVQLGFRKNNNYGRNSRGKKK